VVAIRRSSGLKLALSTSECASVMAVARRISQTRTVSSEAVLMTRVPSPSKPTSSTWPSWPRRTVTRPAPAADLIRTVPSIAPAASRCPSLLKLTESA